MAIQTLWQDFRYATRTLLKKPGFVLVAVLTLAIGLGANAVIFSLVNSVLLSPLPYPNPDQLVMIWQKLPTHGLNKLNISPAEYVDYRDGNQSFSAIASYASLGRNLTGVSEPERVDVTFVTRGFFDVLAVQPLHGRKFLDEEDAPGRNQVAILSHDLWRRHFAGDPGASKNQPRIDKRAVRRKSIRAQHFDTNESVGKLLKESYEHAGFGYSLRAQRFS